MTSCDQVEALHQETQRLANLAAAAQALAVVHAVKTSEAMLDCTDTLSPEATEWREVYFAVAELDIDIAKIQEADPVKIRVAAEHLSIVDASPAKEQE